MDTTQKLTPTAAQYTAHLPEKPLTEEQAARLQRHREYVKWKLGRYGVTGKRLRVVEKSTAEGRKLAAAMARIAQLRREGVLDEAL